MTFNDHATTFAGLPVAEFGPDGNGAIDDPEGHAYRLRLDYGADVSFQDYFASFLQDPNAERVRALLLGAWTEEMYDESTAELVESIVAAAPRLPNLMGLFLVDIVFEENEVSWIVQSDVSPIWQAFPKLEYVTLRGSQSLSLGDVRHDTLRNLTIECGGLPREVLHQVAKAKLPELEHLELYLGTSYYGWDGTMEDVAAVLAADFPKLKYLGLRDSDQADAVAELVANSPILERIDVLDLSLGTLGDDGGRALLESDGVKTLKRLDLHRHFMSPGLAAELDALPLEVDVGDPQGETPPDDRYVAIGE